MAVSDYLLYRDRREPPVNRFPSGIAGRALLSCVNSLSGPFPVIEFSSAETYVHFGATHRKPPAHRLPAIGFTVCLSSSITLGSVLTRSSAQINKTTYPISGIEQWYCLVYTYHSTHMGSARTFRQAAGDIMG